MASEQGVSSSSSPAADGRVDRVVSELAAGIDRGKIPIEIHNDDLVHQQELERIFGQTWTFIGHTSEIPGAGDYALRYIGEDPFIFVRGEDEEIRVLFNSCRHRGAKLCRAERGNASHFRCPYHGWTYKNDGDLIGVKEKNNGFKDMDKDEYGLQEAPHVDTYGGLVFASIDPDAEPLEAHLGDARWYLDIVFELVDWEVVGEPQRWVIDTNWKPGPDNFSGDNYHLDITHLSLSQLDIGTDTATASIDSHLVSVADIDGHGVSTYLGGEDEEIYWGFPDDIVDEFNHDELDDAQRDIARRSATFLGNIFPNLSFFLAKGTNDPTKDGEGFFFIRQWQPKGPGQAELWNWPLAPASASDSFKERINEIVTGTFSMSGNYDVDDIAVLDGITEAGGSVFARKHDTKTSYIMGVDTESDATAMDDWDGPGTAYTEGKFTDQSQLEFYRAWLETMRDD